MSQNILRIDASARHKDSSSRKYADMVIRHISAHQGDVEVTVRDLAQGLPFVDKKWVKVKSKNPDKYTKDDKATVSLSRILIEELKQNDCYVISCPIYNFTIPASLKAWIDLITFPGQTFESESGEFEGLLNDKSLIVTFSSSTTKIGSDIDFASDYLSHIFGFLGVDDITFIGGHETCSYEHIIEALDN